MTNDTPAPIEDTVAEIAEISEVVQKESEYISIDDVLKVEVAVGTVLSAERVPETDKLLRLVVSFGEEEGPRQIVSGINEYVSSPEDLVNKQLAFITNLKPRTIKGLVSNGMLFAVGNKETFAFLSPDREVPPGTNAH